MSYSKQTNKQKQNPFLSHMSSTHQQPESGSMINILSPRNLMKLISNTIDDYNTKPKSYKPDPLSELQFISSFQPYWLKINHEFHKHTASKRHKVSYKQKQQKNQQLLLRLKLQKVPQSYFDQKFELFFSQKFNKIALIRKQQEVTDYLDDIQVVIFNKTSRNPEKYFNCVGNFHQTISLVEGSLQKVKFYRQKQQTRLVDISRSQLNIKKIHQKRKRIQLTLQLLESIKKLKSVKEQSEQPLYFSNSGDFSGQKRQSLYIESKFLILQNVKRKELQICAKIKSLQKIINNLQYYRNELKALIYEQFNFEIVELMSKVLSYDKQIWYTKQINPKMLGKQFDSHNLLEQSRLNITVLDQSCFAFNDTETNNQNLTNSQTQNYNVFQKQFSSGSQSLKDLIEKLNKTWTFIQKFDLYDEVQVNQLIMRELVRHNILFNKDLDEYLTKLFQQFQPNNLKQPNINSILEEDLQNQEDISKSKSNSYTEENSQEIEEETSQVDAPKKNKYFSAISQFTGINELKTLNNLKELSHLKKKTINTFKRFGNIKKIGQALSGNVQKQVNVPTDSYCKVKQNQISKKQKKLKFQTQQKLSKVDTKFFLKAVRCYYEMLSSITKFLKENRSMIFWLNFSDKLYSFIEERVKFFFSLRHINENTSISDFLLYLNLIDYWLDVQDQVYENLSKLKCTTIDEYLTNLQKNALVNELKKSIDQSAYASQSVNSSHINRFYYVFFWTHIQQIKNQQANNMSITILNSQNHQSSQKQTQQNIRQFQIQKFQSQLKIIDKRIVYKHNEFFVCESFIDLLKQLEKYLQLMQVLTEFNLNIEEKICQVVGFYVWYNLKNINKTVPSVKPRTLKNLCNIYSTISLLKIIFSEQLQISNKKYAKTLSQFDEFFKAIDGSISLTPFLLIEQQISLIYENNAVNTQFQIPCKETTKILQIFRLCLQQLKIHFGRQKIVKILEPSIKVINKNYFGYLSSLGKRGLLEIKQFLPKLKELLLNYGFKQDKLIKPMQNETHIFLKQITEIEISFRSKFLQIK